jgi:hypothetical protein
MLTEAEILVHLDYRLPGMLFRAEAHEKRPLILRACLYSLHGDLPRSQSESAPFGSLGIRAKLEEMLQEMGVPPTSLETSILR